MNDRGRRIWAVVLIALVVLGIVVAVVMRRANPILKGRVIDTLSARFDARVELDRLDVSVLHGLQVSGNGLRIFPPADVVAAGATNPLIAITAFSFRASVLGLFFKPTHVGRVYVNGMTITVPPREMRKQDVRGPEHRGKIKIIVQELICDNSRLVIGTAKPGKEPKTFYLKHAELHHVRENAPWQYQATLINAIPKGEIQTSGDFGPWQTESPGDSLVKGHYTFENADLYPIKGVGGTLSSVGDFTGQLNKIAVAGTTETPNFSLDSANHPMPLHTRFKAVVDGTTGDTYLQAVDAVLGASSFRTSGQVINMKGVGHVIDLDVDVPAGHIQDFLQLAVKADRPVMTGIIGMQAKLHIPPGKESVPQKIRLDGQFKVRDIHFANPAVQDKVDILSLRAQGRPREAKPGAPDVESQMAGVLDMQRGKISFQELVYTMPGGDVNLTGVYTLSGERFEFSGEVRTHAELSQMVATWWKSLLLKPFDRLFQKDGAGAVIPVTISGTKSEPKFGLALMRKSSKDKGAQGKRPANGF